ncbi:hypothetical protein [Hoeflea sp. TYP-13]|uniref:hypothetical protein n=1 Tax=Hoeflea sp. TYP-13 TaxID=3230023 RepID=UPI0034C68DA4
MTIIAAFILAFGITASATASEVVIERVHTDTVMHVGQRYWVDITVKTTTEVEITEACFIWSGAGPYCFPVILVEKNKQIRVSVVARKPRKYNIDVYVKYNSGGKVYESNRVSLNVDVKS